MKRLLSVILALFAATAFGATLYPVSLMNPAGSTAGQVPLSTGPTTAPAWGSIGLANLPQAAANTVLGNGTASTAAVTALAVPSCSGAGNAVKWTSAAGWGCVSGLALTANPLSQFAATTSAQLAGVLSDESGSGSLLFGTSPTIGSPAITGGTINNATVGITTPLAGKFTALTSTTNAKVAATNTSAQSIPTGANTTVTSWTAGFDVSSNFVVATGVFTAPTTGYYRVSGCIYFNAVGAVGTLFRAIVVANSAVVGIYDNLADNATPTNHPVYFNKLISLAAGQTVFVQAFQNSGAAAPLNSAAGTNFIEFVQEP